MGTVALAMAAVTPAQAWTLDSFKWNIGSSGTYCLASTVTVHGPDWIDSAVRATISYSNSKTYYLPGSSGNCGLYWTTLHEFGHSQGLQHTTVSTAVMWKADNGTTSLQPDDIAGLRARYP